MRSSSSVQAAALGGILIVLLASCTTLAMPAGPKPGTVGFYEVEPIPGKVATQDVRARRMSNPEDRVFVYRVNDNMVVLGVGAPSGTTEVLVEKVRSFDELSRGVVISPDSAKKLAAYLDKVVALYDDKTKKTSVYLDFRVMIEVPVLAKAEAPRLSLKPQAPAVSERSEPLKEEEIEVRFQYVYHQTGPEPKETTNFYLGSKVEEMTYTDVKILSSNLAKP